MLIHWCAGGWKGQVAYLSVKVERLTVERDAAREEIGLLCQAIEAQQELRRSAEQMALRLFETIRRYEPVSEAARAWRQARPGPWIDGADVEFNLLTAVDALGTLSDSVEPSEQGEQNEESRWHDYVMRRLAQLQQGDGDFTGLLRPSEELVERARIVSTLFPASMPTPSVVPSECGNVLFIWRRADLAHRTATAPAIR